MGIRLKNVITGNKLENEDPLGAEMEYDGQKYFVGPGGKVNFANDGVANSLVSQSRSLHARIDYDKGNYGATEGYIRS